MFKHTLQSSRCTYTDLTHNTTHTHTHWRYDSEGSNWNEDLGSGGELVTVWISTRLPRSPASSRNQLPTAVQGLAL